MNHQELKKAISEDVETIKQIDPEIIPANVYYPSLLKLFASGFWKIWLIVSLTIAYAGINHPSNEGLAGEAIAQVMREAILMAFFLSIGAMVLLTPSMNFFIQFKFHLEKKLKVGAICVKKFKQIAYLFLSVFTILCFLFGKNGESSAIFMLVGFAFFGSMTVTYFVVNMELNRIGLSTIFTLFSHYFNKGKNLGNPLPKE